jgi:RNA-dependent RNA polymerase
MTLAELCSQAVDYPKNGTPVNINNNTFPKPLIRFKPDWHKTEVTGAHELDYYVSDRALGHLFRNVKLHDPKELVEGLSTRHSGEAAPLKDAITCAVEPHIRRALDTIHDNDKSCADDGFVEQLYAQYVREMRFICVTHTLVDAPDVRLTEEEVVLGTILATSTQPRWRSNRSYRMKEHTKDLVGSIRSQIIQCGGSPTKEQLRAALPRAWAVWCWAQHHRDEEYIESFALLVLSTMLDSLECHGMLPATKSTRNMK